MPNLTVEPTSGGFNVGPSSNANLQAFDGTGLLAGPMEEGVGFLDTTELQTGMVGSELLNDYLVRPRDRWQGEPRSNLRMWRRRQR